MKYNKLDKKEFEKLYFKRFKRFFKDRKDPLASMMGYGLEIKSGWYDLVWNLTDCIDVYLKNNKRTTPQDLQILQIKEKYGQLRFYTSQTDSTIHGMVWFAEYLSGGICEFCGKDGTIDDTNGWYKTLCPRCIIKRKKEAEKIRKRWDKK